MLRKPRRHIIDPKDPTYAKNGCELWKESFHIRIFIKTAKDVKTYLRKKMMEKLAFQALFSRLQMVNTLDEAFDKNIVSNPIMLLGSMKKSGNKPHELETLFHVTFDSLQGVPVTQVQDDFKKIMRDSHAIVDGSGRKCGIIPPVAYCKFNLCYEMSLHFEAPGGLIKKHEYNPKAKYKSEIRTFHERMESEASSTYDLEAYENQVSTITVMDFDANYIKKILDILGRPRAERYNDWKTVIMALARKSKEYKPLAIWFSLRYGQSFVKDGMKQLDGIWNSALQRNGPADDDQKHTTVNTLYYWARLDNMEEYVRLQDENIFLKTKNLLWEQAGKLNHSQYANLLREMFGSKFKCDKSAVSLKRGDVVWREFVLESDDHTEGELFKWRKEEQLFTMMHYISEKMPLHLGRVKRYCLDKIEQTRAAIAGGNTNIDLAKDLKYYEIVSKGISAQQFNLGNQSLIKPIISACEGKFIRDNRGFEARMDTDPIHIGVINGVLRLKPKIKLITGYHEIPISKCVKVPYVPYDETDGYVMKLEKVLLEIFNNNPETYKFWMMYLASGLDDCAKTPQFFSIWHGGGAQGKSVINELDLNTFGLGTEGGYAMKMDIGWFCSERKGQGPDSALSSTKKMRRIWCSESGVEASPKCAKIKEITSDHVAGNDKNEKQEVWKVNSHITVPTNHEMRINERDYGTWRRILYYKFKRNFKRKDGPIGDRFDDKDPTHSEAKQEIIDEWIYDRNFQTAYFSILVHYYEIFRDTYSCDIRKVPKTEIDKETAEYFDRLDVFSQFVSERIIMIGEYYSDGTKVSLVPVSDIMQKYMKWHNTTISAGAKFNPTEIKTTILKHYRLEKYFKLCIGGEYLQCHKVLDLGEIFTETPTEEKRAIATKINTETTNAQIADLARSMPADNIDPAPIPQPEIIDDLDFADQPDNSASPDPPVELIDDF